MLNATQGFLLLLTGTVLLKAYAGPAPAGGLTVTAGSSTAVASTNRLGPRIQFATRDANFGQVKKGEPVKYTFIFTNTGDQVLHILHVQPGCGCTQAGEWTKQVEPGKTGSIPIQLATVNFQGEVAKFVTVTCDDKTIPQGVVQLTIRGNIWSPVDVIPQYLSFVIPPDAAGGSGRTTITNHLSEPMYLSAPQCSNPAFTLELKTNVPGYGYELVVRRVPPLSPGMSQAAITLNTSLTNPATLTAHVWANVQAPVTLFPSQLMVSAPPLTNPAPYTIGIQNSTTNLMTLSEPAVNAKDVKVELKELVRGRYYNAVLTFPPGFEIAPGQHVEFTAKSTLPKYPVLSVPIAQQPKPATHASALASQAAAAPVASPKAQPQALQSH